MKLTLVEKTMIPVYRNESHETIINARELHEFLEVGKDFTTWMKDRIEKYGFVDGEDYLLTKIGEQLPSGTKFKHEYLLKLDCAKEIAMVENNEQGRTVRKYFIEVEKRARRMAQQAIPDFTNPAEAARAWAEQFEQRTATQKLLELAQPKVLFADSVAASQQSILVGDMAKILSQNGVDIGAKRLFVWLRENGYLMKSTEAYNMPTQKARELNIIEIKEGTHVNPDGSVRLTKTPKINGKGQIYFVDKFLNEMRLSA